MESRLRRIHQGRLLLIRFCFCWIQFITSTDMLGDRLDVGVKAGRGGEVCNLGATETILVLQNRFWYYRIDFGTTESIPVMQNRFWYCRIDLGTKESILVLPRSSRGGGGGRGEGGSNRTKSGTKSEGMKNKRIRISKQRLLICPKSSSSG